MTRAVATRPPTVEDIALAVRDLLPAWRCRGLVASMAREIVAGTARDSLPHRPSFPEIAAQIGCDPTAGHATAIGAHKRWRALPRETRLAWHTAVTNLLVERGLEPLCTMPGSLC